MKALIYLYYLKMKGNIRHVFTKPGTAIFAILLILMYGGLFIVMLMNGKQVVAMYNIKSINTAIFVGIGFTAFMVGTMLLQSRKALFMENDAFYLFSGPFKKKHTMQFLMSQSIVGALLCGAISLFMMVMFGSDIQYNVLFLLLVFVAHSLAYFFFTVLYYYVYLLSIKRERYKYVSYMIVFLFIVCVVGVYIGVLAQHNFSLPDSGMQFLNSNLFHFVPIFGWIKLMLVSYVSGEMGLMLLGLVLLTVACAIVYLLMLHYKGEFVEKAMQDAIEFSAKYNEIRAGKRTSLKDKKVKNIKGTFKEGAAAIQSKNMLLMRKSNSFLTFGDITFIVIYLIIAVVGNLGLVFFIYMMMIWLFTAIQNAEFMKEMDNYHIYLIPDSPLKKLLYLLAPYFVKFVLLVMIPVVIGGVLLHASIPEIIQYYFMIAGYACLFISASVLATRLLKSRNNSIMENMFRMLIVAISAIPSILLIVMIVSLGLFSEYMMSVISIFSLLMNFIVSAMIIYSCRSMMNGREIQSE